jgi:hypothetical protein
MGKRKLGLIGFVLFETERGCILICTCWEYVYVHLGLSEIGFVLHKKADL